jgi:hypothetical protein
VFSWGKSLSREDYIKALRQADKGNYGALLAFVKE